MRVYQRTKEPAKDKAVHPVVRWIWRQMNLQRASQEDVAALDKINVGEGWAALIARAALAKVEGEKGEP